MRMIFFKDVNNPPPGGFFCEIAGERVTAPTFLEMLMKLRPLAIKHRITQPLESYIAAYMAPRVDDPGRYFFGPDIDNKARVRQLEAFENSQSYLKRQLVPFDKLSRRYQVCFQCPQHKRDWCPTCTGHPGRFDVAFGGRRVKVPEDKVSGVCQCAKAYEYVINAVEYSPEDKIWDGAPETCWRYNDV